MARFLAVNWPGVLLGLICAFAFAYLRAPAPAPAVENPAPKIVARAPQPPAEAPAPIIAPPMPQARPVPVRKPSVRYRPRRPTIARPKPPANCILLSCLFFRANKGD